MRLANRWWTVLAAFLGLVVGNGPLLQFSFGVFLKPLSEAFGVDRGAISAVVLISFICTAICTPIAGRLVDRYGVRPVALTAIVLFALAIAALGLSPASAPVFVALYALAGVAAAGQTPLPYAKAVTGAFERRRGLALGVSMAGVGVGTALVPQIAQLLIARVGWREAYVGLGALVFVLAFPAVFFLLREPPLLARARRGDPEAAGLSAREALRDRTFWLFIAIFFCVAIAAAGTIAHIAPLLTDRGVAPQMAAGAISAAGLALIVGRLVAGYLLDRVFAPYVAFVLFLCPLAGMVLLYGAATPTVAIAAAVLVGVGLGAEVDLMAFLLSRYLGMRAFGEIYGYLFAIFMLASGLGPFFMGFSFSHAGSYDPAIVVFGVGLALACGLTLLLGPYRYPATVTTQALH